MIFCLSLDLTPEDHTLIRAFFAARGIVPFCASAPERMQQVVRAFGPVLYENLSKIRRRAAFPKLEPDCLETPAVLLRDHLEKGTGGTCYSMAYSLAALLESAGIDCYLTLNDIRGQRANHAAVVANVEGVTWLCDPGVQFRVPAMFSAGATTSADNGFCIVHIMPTDVPGDFNVKLQMSGTWTNTPSFIFHSTPVDEPTFRRVWLQSFTGPMMNTFHIFRHYDTHTRHLLYGCRQDKIPGKPEMKEPVTIEELPRHVHEVWPEIPEGHMEGAWEALTARGASPVLSFEDCLRVESATDFTDHTDFNPRNP
jgi:hypothetical protein